MQELEGYILIYRKFIIAAIFSIIVMAMITSKYTAVQPTAFIPSLDGSVRNPTYEEALWFMQTNNISDNPYTEHYTCLNFSVDTAKSAIDMGIMCFPVIIITEGAETSHAVVAFHTTNMGLVYYEPQNDRIINPLAYKPPN